MKIKPQDGLVPKTPYKEFPLNTSFFILLTLTRIKNHSIKTTSKKTGAIILVSFLAIVSFSAIFLYFSYVTSENQKSYENTWRLQPCDVTVSDYTKNPEIWKRDGIIDKKC